MKYDKDVIRRHQGSHKEIFSDIFKHYSLNHFHEALFMKLHY